MNLNNDIKTSVVNFIRIQAKIEHYVTESLNNDSGIELSILLIQNLFEKKLFHNEIILEIINKINKENNDYFFKVFLEKMNSKDAFFFTN